MVCYILYIPLCCSSHTTVTTIASYERCCVTSRNSSITDETPKLGITKMTLANAFAVCCI